MNQFAILSILSASALQTLHAQFAQGEFTLDTASQDAFQADDGDLVNVGSPYLKSVSDLGYTPTPPRFGELDVLNDGMTGQPTTAADGVLQTHGSYGVAFELDTARSPDGYDIDEIRIIAAWQEQRAAQHVRIEALLVGSEEPRELATIKQIPFGNQNNASMLVLRPLDGDLLASGVRTLRFTMLPLTGDDASNFGVYREIDVFGAPSRNGTNPFVSRIQTESDSFDRKHAEKAAHIRKVATAYQPESGGHPTLDYFLTKGLPVQDLNTDELILAYDAPTITNNRLWAQAVTSENRNGILDMEDVWAGAEVVEGTMRYTLKGRWKGWQDPLWSTTKVRLDGAEVAPSSMRGDWLPNTVIRQETIGDLSFTGTVKAAAGYAALLQRLTVENLGENTKTAELEFLFSPASGEFALASGHEPVRREGVYQVFHYKVTLNPGETRHFDSVLCYREPDGLPEQLLAEIDAEFKLADAYWNALLADAFDPAPGPFLSGGVPRYSSPDAKRERFYDFGVVTALMVMANFPERMADSNLYLVAVADAPYMRWLYMWDSSYAAETLALLDPEALKSMIKIWCGSGIQKAAAADSVTGAPVAQWYASNFSSFTRMLKAYLDWTGDFDILSETVEDKTVLQHTLAASAFNDTRPQRDGLMHANTEHHLFDRGTVKGYEHYVAFPNMGDVWGKRQLAEILEAEGQSAQADELLAKADAREEAVITHLYNDAPGYEGTWKQIYENGQVQQIRHGIDFMHGGMSLTDALSAEQKQAMRDWYYEQIFLYGAEGGTWVISQDRRDGNNGPHQMEHNGNGAYPGWPYHYAWSLHAMGYHDDVRDLLDLIVNITDWGAIGQGHARDGRRSRSGWAEVAGAFPVPYILNFLFGLDPSGDELQASPTPALEPGATLEGLRWHDGIYDVDAGGRLGP